MPVAYGIKKLQISCVVEDDKVGTDFLEETITAFEEHVSQFPLVNITSLILLFCVGSECGHCGLQQNIKNLLYAREF